MGHDGVGDAIVQRGSHRLGHDVEVNRRVEAARGGRQTVAKRDAEGRLAFNRAIHREDLDLAHSLPARRAFPFHWSMPADVHVEEEQVDGRLVVCLVLLASHMDEHKRQEVQQRGVACLGVEEAKAER
eukprot:scaffold1829_cov194-Ochromonas_danica.AAC.17